MSGASNGAGVDALTALAAQVQALQRQLAALAGDDQFPVDTYKDAAPHLRRPFTPQAVKWKVQTTYRNGKGALVVPYIDARLVIERLNRVCPHLWKPAPRFENGGLWCDLTVDGITRTDLGEGYKGKGLWSDALKRAAVHFGIGVSLYATPKQQLWGNTPHLRVWNTNRKDDRGNDIWAAEIEDAGYEHLARVYTDWLDKTGRDLYGEPLDHGDVAGSVGDVEGLDGEPADVVGAAPAEMVDAILKGVDHLGLDEGGVNLVLGSLGMDAVEGDFLEGDRRSAFEAMSIDDAARILAELRGEASKRKAAERLDQGIVDGLMQGIEFLGLDLGAVNAIVVELGAQPLDPTGLPAALYALSADEGERLSAELQRRATRAGEAVADAGA